MRFRLLHRKAFTVLLSVLTTAMIAGGCGASRTIDSNVLEAEIEAQLLPNFPGAIRSISCPDAVDPAPGQTLLCVATMGGQVFDVDVTIGGTAEALTTSASVEDRFVAVNEVAALLAATFGDEIGLATSVDCGQPVAVLALGDSLVCSATDPSGVTRSFDVEVAADGLLTLNLR